MKRNLQIACCLLAPMLLTAGLRAAGEADPMNSQIVRGSDSFGFRYSVTVPKLEKPGRLWIPLAASDADQDVELLGVTTRDPWRRVEDKEFGNQILVMDVPAGEAAANVVVDYKVTRKEKPAYAAAPGENLDTYLEEDSLVPKSEKFAGIARRVTKDASNNRERGEALYRHTLEHMAYDKSGTGWGRGDAAHACDARTGNCTDFHAYFIGLCRTLGIPARFAIGFSIPADTDEGEIGGYHCWAEYFADGKWIPVDISEADKHPALADYYAGHHPANRFQLTRGRDLVVDPAPSTGAMNYLVYPLLESGGADVPVERSFTFKRLR
ncbi:MAG: transglutaminase domain-containing protein [Verrucomicrobiae bacterium]|nr:transglutaminase domain-containing protein [Verrucomicrobiae bacterium]